MKRQSLWTIRWLKAIDEIDEGQWNRLALPAPTPILEWHWLHHLEASGSISPRYGWQPCHLTVWEDQTLIGAAALYIKTHSEGEFIFDHGWAGLAEKLGIAYYPKMVGMSPATPSVGYRFLMASGIDHGDLMHRMLTEIDLFSRQAGLSSCHFSFVDLPWFSQWPSQGFIGWQHQSYLWKNLNYTSFDDYLNRFKASQRRNIRRERRRMETCGITIHALTGDDIGSDMAEIMYRYYLQTNARYGRWAARFLNGDFFKRIFKDYRHRLLIIAAQSGASPTPLALSLLLVKGNHLIGRYWGGATFVKDLHFNMCFYAPIEWAIDNTIQTFDPGVGSPHKIHRGFEAVANTSLHRFYDPRLYRLFDRFIGEVNEAQSAEIEMLNRMLPFSRDRY
jgi:uncharacterized protein